MNSEQINNWVQTFTSLAIVVGLVLVILELQQNRESTQSQLTSDFFQQMSQMHGTVMGEQAAMVLAKACDAPQDLERWELVVLDSYYLALVNRLDRLLALQARGRFYSDYDMADFEGNLDVILRTAPGRAYMKTATFRRFRHLIDERLEEDWDGCGAFYDSWEANIQAELR